MSFHRRLRKNVTLFIVLQLCQMSSDFANLWKKQTPKEFVAYRRLLKTFRLSFFCQSRISCSVALADEALLSLHDMVFSAEDRILIENLYKLKTFVAKRLIRDFPDKSWNVRS